VINHACPTGLHSSKISELPLAIIKIFYAKHKSKIFDQWKDEKKKLNEKDMLVLHCFYASVNVLSKYYETSESFYFDKKILFWIFDEFSDFLSSNFISQIICEALLYCICNVVDNEEKKYFKFPFGIIWFRPFEKCFYNPRASTEIKLASAFILSYFIEEDEPLRKKKEDKSLIELWEFKHFLKWRELRHSIKKEEFKYLRKKELFEHLRHLKAPVQEYLQSILEMPAMKKFKTFCGFKEEEIVKCIGILGKLILPYLFLVPVFS